MPVSLPSRRLAWFLSFFALGFVGKVTAQTTPSEAVLRSRFLDWGDYSVGRFRDLAPLGAAIIGIVKPANEDGYNLEWDWDTGTPLTYRRVISTQPTVMKRSTDHGLTWTSLTLPPDAPYVSRLVSGNGNCIAYSDQSPNSLVCTNEDGVGWQRVTGPSEGEHFRMIFANGQFHQLVDTVLGARFYTSADGLSWVQGPVSDRRFVSFTLGKGRYVATSKAELRGGFAFAEVWSVSAGSNDWQSTAIPVATNARDWGVAFGNGRFYVATSESQGRVSEDGLEWSGDYGTSETGTVSEHRPVEKEVCGNLGCVSLPDTPVETVSFINGHFVRATPAISWTYSYRFALQISDTGTSWMEAGQFNGRPAGFYMIGDRILAIMLASDDSDFARRAATSITPAPPIIYSHPQSVVLAPGEATSLTVEVGPSPFMSITYQWYEGAIGNVSTPVAGATSAKLELAGERSASYWVRVTNEVGSADSAVATHRITRAPIITTQPVNVWTRPLHEAPLRVVARQAETYQWYEGYPGDTSKPVNGATSDALWCPSRTPLLFWVRVSNSYGTADSRSASLSWRPGSPPSLSGNLVGGVGTSLRLDVQNLESGFTGALEWRMGERPVASTTTPLLWLPSVSMSDAGTYSVLWKYGDYSERLGSATITVYDGASQLRLAKAGTTATLTVPVQGDGLRFDWQAEPGTKPLTSNARASGVTTNSLSIAKVERGDSGRYRCVLRTLRGETVATVRFQLAAANQADFMLQAVSAWRVGGTVPTDFLDLPRGARVTFAGLPPGVSASPYGGLVGRPTKPGTYTIRAAITLPTGEVLSANATVTVAGLSEPITGTYVGLVEHSTLGNGSLGGTFTATVTSAGAVTGKITLGAISKAFVGRFDEVVTTSYYWPYTPSIHYAASISNVPDAGGLAMELGSSFGYLTFTVRFPEGRRMGYARKLASPAQTSANAGIYIAAVPPLNATGHETTIPQGVGYFGGTWSATGAYMAAARFADNTVATCGTWLCSDGTAPLHWLLYGGTGSIQGSFTSRNGALDGYLMWTKHPQRVATRSYRDGFGAHSLNIVGGRMHAYGPKDPVLGLADKPGNVRYAFTAPSPAMDWQGSLRINADNVVSLPAGTPFTLSLVPAMSKFLGNITQPGFAGPFYGIFVDRLGKGLGHAQVPASTAKDAPLMSVRVELTAAP